MRISLPGLGELFRCVVCMHRSICRCITFGNMTCRCVYAVYSLAHRVMCIADAAELSPSTVDAAQQLRTLKAEARQLLAEAAGPSSASTASG